METLEERDLDAVPDSRSAGKQADRDVESERRSQPAKLVDRQPWRNRSLDPAHLRLRDTCRARDVVLAESCLDAGRPNLIAYKAPDPRRGASCLGSAPVDRGHSP